MRLYTTILIVTILVASTLMFSGCEEYTYTKIKQEDDLPQIVRKALSETELERGGYFFSSGFTVESAYIVICGGEKHLSLTDLESIFFAPLCLQIGQNCKHKEKTQCTLMRITSTFPAGADELSLLPNILYSFSCKNRKVYYN